MRTKINIMPGVGGPGSYVAPPLSPGSTLPFTPSTEMGKPEDERAVYHIRPPNFRSRSAADHDVMPVTLAAPSDELTNDAALAAIDTVVEASQRDQVRAVLAAFQALLDDTERMKDDDEARTALIREARGFHAQLTPYVPALQRIFADRIYANSLSNFAKARFHIAGWERVFDTAKTPRPVKFETNEKGILTENALGRVPPHHIPEIAAFVDDLTNPSEVVEKNSP